MVGPQHHGNNFPGTHWRQIEGFAEETPCVSEALVGICMQMPQMTATPSPSDKWQRVRESKLQSDCFACLRDPEPTFWLQSVSRLAGDSGVKETLPTLLVV